MGIRDWLTYDTWEEYIPWRRGRKRYRHKPNPTVRWPSPQSNYIYINI